MAFLESCWEQDVAAINDKDGDDDGPQNNRLGYSMYTVVAKEDCQVWRWHHRDMKNLLQQSSDMQAALTRAMTSAVVGKVINFTVSRSSSRPSWQTWLDDWKHARSTSTVTASYVEAPATPVSAAATKAVPTTKKPTEKPSQVEEEERT